MIDLKDLPHNNMDIIVVDNIKSVTNPKDYAIYVQRLFQENENDEAIMKVFICLNGEFTLIKEIKYDADAENKNDK